MLETLDYTIRIGSTPTFLYFDLYEKSLGYNAADLWKIVFPAGLAKSPARHPRATRISVGQLKFLHLLDWQPGIKLKPGKTAAS